MRIIKVVLVVLLLSCNSNPNNDNELGVIIDLIKKEKLSEADSIFHSVEYTKKIDFNYKLIDIVLKFKKTKFTEGLLASQIFINNYPNNPFGYYYAGLCDFNIINYSSAENYFTQSLDKFNSSAKNGFIYLEKKNERSHFDEASIYDDLIFMTGLSKRFVGKYKASITYMESCLSRQYRIADAYLIIGDCYYNLNDKVNARQYYLLAKQNGNKDAEQFLNK